MARCGVTITKSFSFRGAAQEFNNTYYYNVPEPLNATVADNLVNLIVGLERNRHQASVSFVRARAWSAGGSPATNNMLVDKPLTGTGDDPNTNSAIDRERAFLVRFRAGVDSKGRPVYLRKWWHFDVSAVGGEAISSGAQRNTDPLTSAIRSNLVTYANQFKELAPAGAGGPCTLISENGRAITGDTVAHPYLEHHQLGDMWR